MCMKFEKSTSDNLIMKSNFILIFNFYNASVVIN